MKTLNLKENAVDTQRTSTVDITSGLNHKLTEEDQGWLTYLRGVVSYRRKL